MHYAALVVATFAELRVCAVVTAGVEGNAGCAGDPANWHEAESGQMERHPHDGTINSMLLVNWPLTPGAMARAVVTMTEGKSAALKDLAVSSRYSQDLATERARTSTVSPRPGRGEAAQGQGGAPRETGRIDRLVRPQGDPGGAEVAERAGSVPAHAASITR